MSKIFRKCDDQVGQFYVLLAKFKNGYLAKYRSEKVCNKQGEWVPRRTELDDLCEKLRRVHDLSSYEESTALALVISKCDHDKGRPCLSIACPDCAKIFNAALVQYMRSRVFKNIKLRDMFLLTAYCPHYILQAGELSELNPENIIRWFRRFIKPLLDAGAQGYVIIELIYRTKEQVYLPHFHFVGTGITPKDYYDFCETDSVLNLKASARKAGLVRPLVLEWGKSKVGTKYPKTAMLSYLCKFTTSWKDNYNNRTRCTRPHGQLANGVDGRAIHVEQLVFLHESGIDKLFYPIGCRMKKLPVDAVKKRPNG